MSCARFGSREDSSASARWPLATATLSASSATLT